MGRRTIGTCLRCRGPKPKGPGIRHCNECKKLCPSCKTRDREPKQWHCAPCKKAYMRGWVERNREHVRKYQRRYYNDSMRSIPEVRE